MGVPFAVGYQVLLGYVSMHVCRIDQNMSSGIIFRRFRMRHVVIPIISLLETGIDVDDHTPVFEKAVVDRLADGKLGSGVF